MTIRLYYYAQDDSDAESILSSGFHDEQGSYPGAAPGVWLSDDPLVHYECCHIDNAHPLLRVELDATGEALLAFPSGGDGTTSHLDIGGPLGDAWLRTGIPIVGLTHSSRLIPAEWLNKHASKIEIVVEEEGDLWETVARERKPRPSTAAGGPPLDKMDSRVGVFARIVNRHPFDDSVGESIFAAQESPVVFLFDRLIRALIRRKIPLERCGGLLSQAARRVAVDSFRRGKNIRQRRAARYKSADARALDAPEVVKEAIRLREEGVPVARLRRRLIAKFGPDKVPSETVIRRRWLRYVRDHRP